MFRPSSIRVTKYLLLLVVALAIPQRSLASDFMKEGMADYAAGNFCDAAGHFGGALATDFNNATLHYYLGSCYAHMKQKESAVREFRIAYALEPEKEVGRFSKQALEIYGFDPGGPVDKKLHDGTGGKAGTGLSTAGTSGGAKSATSGSNPGALGTNTGALPPAQGQSLVGNEPPKPKTMLEKQAEDLKNLRMEQSRLSSEESGKQGEQFVRSKQNDLLDANRYITRWGRVVEPKLSVDDTRSLDSLKKMYDSQKSSYLEVGAKQNAEIQSTAASLQDQMNAQQKAGKVHLSPSGTNLYVRTYEMTPTAADSKSSGKTSTVQSGTTK